MANGVLRSTGALLDLIGEIYDSAIAPERWPATLSRITQLLDGRHAAITITTFDKPDFAFQAKWNAPPGFEETLRKHYAANPFVPAAWYAAIDEPISAFRFIGEKELKRSRWFRETLGALQQGDAALVLLARSVSRFGSLSVHREAEQPMFDDDELELLRMLAPHLRRAVMIADMLDARALERDMLSAALDQLAVGIVLTDVAGRIVHANASATRHFERATALRRDGDLLSARDPTAATDLSRTIADAASGTTVDVPRSGFVVSVPARTPDRDLAAWVLPLDGGLRRNLGAGFAARVAVFIRSLGDTAPFPAELFVRRYDITPAECRVMMLLVQGMPLSETAEMLGIALPTAKTHLSRLFQKTGTQRQADLMRLAMSALAPAAAP